MQQPKVLRDQLDFGRKTKLGEWERSRHHSPLTVHTLASVPDRFAFLTWTGDSLLLPLLPLSLSWEAPQNCQLGYPHHSGQRCSQNGFYEGHSGVNKRKWKEEGPKMPKSSGNRSYEYTHSSKSPCADIVAWTRPWQQRGTSWEKHTRLGFPPRRTTQILSTEHAQ